MKMIDPCGYKQIIESLGYSKYSSTDWPKENPRRFIDPCIDYSNLMLSDDSGAFKARVSIDNITSVASQPATFTGHMKNMLEEETKKESKEMKEFKVGDRVCIVTDGNYKEGLKNTHGFVKRIYDKSNNCPYGIKVDAKSNPRSHDGVFWFNACDLRIISEDAVKNLVYVPATNPDIKIKKIIYSDRKTIIIWGDKTKTIVSCKEDDIFDPYAGFCAAVTKKLFGSTSKAKKFVTKVSGVDVISEPEGEE